MSAPVRESKTSLPPWTRRSFRSDVTLRNLLRNTAPPPSPAGARRESPTINVLQEFVLHRLTSRKQ